MKRGGMPGKRPGWVKVAGFAAILVLVATACRREAGVTGEVVLIGADGLLSETYVTILETQGMFFSGPALADVAGYREFVTKYEAKAGSGPIQAFHAHAYDSTNILLSLIEEVATIAPDGTITVRREELRRALYEMEDFPGLTGNLTCNPFGDCAQRAISVYQNVDPAEGTRGVFSNVVFTSQPEGVEEKAGPAPTPPTAPLATPTVTIRPDELIWIAAHQAISGEEAALGRDQVTAIEVAIDDWGGELLGREIRLHVEDDLCSAEGGRAGAERIVADPKILGVVGTSCPGAARAALPIYESAGLLVISGSNTSPDLTATGYLEEGDLVQGEYWHYGYGRVAHNDEFQGQGAAQFVFEHLGLRRAATIHGGDPYTEGLVTQFRMFFEQLDGEVVVAAAVGRDDTNIRPVLTEIQAAEPDVIYFPIFQPAGEFLVRQAREIFG